MSPNVSPSHSLLAHFLRFIATTAGRDKILRTLQYFSRFCCWYLYRTKNPHSTIRPFEVIKREFKMTRKILRVGSFVEKFNAACSTLTRKSPMDPVLRYLTVVGHLGYGSYLALDTIILVDIIGVRKMNVTKSLQRLAYHAWMTGLTCNAVASIYSLWKLQRREKTANRKEGDGAIEARRINRERSNTSGQLIATVCDLIIPISELKLININDGLVGMTGFISSLIGIWFQWRKTAVSEQRR
ncbi:uncharacterized protein N7469_007618 [Penicillium citrinum]|uniref:Peroxisomal biogenesis factor 11 n=1 Tax=Penicillium citrinum TaxID=5077 RepID=A0A9W9TLU1_PENCI|nr:uncharacterized protein N7469_007618 [Penicillium citrinum]KAJ5227612.1 hypothetical protein N7469_007618 [Penicillium citrinum]